MPEQYIAFSTQAKKSYFEFIASHNERGPCIQVEDRILGEKFFELIPSCIRVLADQEHDLIVDEVLFGDKILLEYVKQLRAHRVYFTLTHQSPQGLEKFNDQLSGCSAGKASSRNLAMRACFSISLT